VPGVRVFERGDERVEIDVVDHRVVVRHDRGGAVEETAHDASSEAVAKWRADRTAADYVAQGFTRVDGEAFAPSQDELIAQLARDPDDLDTYLVFADWLGERGDPWGQIMSVQTAIAQLPRGTTAADRRDQQLRRDELGREDALLLFQHAARLWGALDTIIDQATQRYAFNQLGPEWHCGFVRSIRLEHDDLPLLAAFAGLDIARLLQEISIGAYGWRRDALAPLVAATWPQLRRVALDLLHDRAAAVDAEAIVPLLDGVRAPKLAELEISASRNTDALCQALAASPLTPRLRSLELHGSELTLAGAQALADAPLHLDKLVITGFGPAHYATILNRKAKYARISLVLQPVVEVEA
jgi:uncharacterized protein (TIGR02996 family)